MSEQKPAYPENKKIRRLTMWAPDPSSETERATLDFSVRGYNYEITVWTRGPAEKGKPPIKASLNATSIGILIENLRFVANAPGKEIADFTTRNSRKVEGSPEKREVHDQGVVRVCKSDQGIVFIGVFDADETRPRILFPFTLDRWTGKLVRGGQQLTESDVSKMVALNVATILEDVHKKNLEITTDSENKEMYGGATKPGGNKPKSNGGYNGGGDSYL